MSVGMMISVKWLLIQKTPPIMAVFFRKLSG